MVKQTNTEAQRSKRAALAALGLKPSQSLPSYAGARWARVEAANDNSAAKKAVR